MPTGDPHPACTCGVSWGGIADWKPCPVHSQTTMVPVTTTWYPGVTIQSLSLTAIEVDASGKRVVVTIDGIRFVTEAADKDQAIALALRVARALGISFVP